MVDDTACLYVCTTVCNWVGRLRFGSVCFLSLFVCFNVLNTNCYKEHLITLIILKSTLYSASEWNYGSLFGQMCCVYWNILSCFSERVLVEKSRIEVVALLAGVCWHVLHQECLIAQDSKTVGNADLDISSVSRCYSKLKINRGTIDNGGILMLRGVVVGRKTSMSAVDDRIQFLLRNVPRSSWRIDQDL